MKKLREILNRTRKHSEEPPIVLSVPEIEVEAPELQPLSPLPTTKGELTRTRKAHRDRIERGQRLTRLFDDYAKTDSILVKRRMV